MLLAPPNVLLAPVDSARAVTQVYSASLLTIGPLVVVALAALALRHQAAGRRKLLWRSAIVALLLLWLGPRYPLHWTVWMLPSALAQPFLLLDRTQLGVDQPAIGGAAGTAATVRALYALYLLGVAIALVPLLRAWLLMSGVVRRARALRDDGWRAAIDEARAAIGVRRAVRVTISGEVRSPFTAGTLRPVVLLPRDAVRWSAAERRAVLLHELAHVRAGDVAVGIVARVVCALWWFHPAAWWIARRLRAECELACDDVVLSCGVRASEYAALLVKVADARCSAPSAAPAAALVRHGGLRHRLDAIVTPGRDLRQPTWLAVGLAAVMTLAVAGPVSAVELVPTRGVLRALMRDARWESRAYAVVLLAARPDSVAVARDAATSDPSPRVRAWATYALRR